MELKIIVIIALILFMAFWFNNPDKGQDIIQQGVDKAKDLVGINSTVCTTQYDPVCGEDNITYNNLCLATKEGLMNVTLGVCA